MSPVHCFSAVVATTAFLVGQIPYGASTSGSGGFAPRLRAVGIPFLGNAGFGLELTEGLGGAIGVVMLSAERADLNLAGTRVLVGLQPQQLLLSTLVVLGGTPAVAGDGSVLLPVPLTSPATPALSGVQLFGQAAVLDPAAAPSGFAASQGLLVEASLPPRIFVGVSGSGSDPYWLVDTASQVVLQTASQAPSEVQRAAFVDGNRFVYAGLSGVNRIDVLDTDNPAAGWSPFWTATNTLSALAYDRNSRRIYTGTYTGGPFGFGDWTLRAIGADPASPTYGSPLASTSGLGAFFPAFSIPSWRLSPSGRHAAILDAQSTPPRIFLVDTDPASSGYMSFTSLGAVPTSPGPCCPLINDCAFTPRDEQLVVSIQYVGSASGEIARFDLGAGSWIDHDPSTPSVDAIGPSSSPSVAPPSAIGNLDVSLDGTTIAAAGFVGGIGRLRIDPQDPAIWDYLPIAVSTTASNTWSCAVSPDGSQIAFVDAPSNAAATLRFVDARTGAPAGSVSLGAIIGFHMCIWR
ncbi:MAG: hypothetical protein AB8H80_21140 [Planctomycetota bacterium]